MPDKKPKHRFDDPAKNQPKFRNDCRKLHLSDGIWQWKTDGHIVHVFSPDGKYHEIRVHELNGMTEESYYDACMDDLPPSVLPSDIASYIENGFKFQS